MEKNTSENSNPFDLKKLLNADTKNAGVWIPLKAQPRRVAIYTDEKGSAVDRYYRFDQFTPQFQRQLLDQEIASIFMDGNECRARTKTGELAIPIITDPADFSKTPWGGSSPIKE